MAGVKFEVQPGRWLKHRVTAAFNCSLDRRHAADCPRHRHRPEFPGADGDCRGPGETGDAGALKPWGSICTPAPGWGGLAEARNYPLRYGV